jgi:uncharacterized protein (UPF0332 family)
MHWRQFQDTAERLAQGATEGDWRSAVSRGYYAVFHFFREYLLTQGLDIGQGGVAHNNLYVGLWNCGVGSVGKIAGRIDKLRIERTKADYNFRSAFAQADAVKWVGQSKTVVSDFQAAMTIVSPAQVVAGARQHLQSIGRLGKTP